MKKLKKHSRIIARVLAVAMVFALAVSIATIVRANGKPADDKVTICHRTNSVTNPYVSESVAADSVDGNPGNDNGQGDHLFDHTGLVFDPNANYPTPHNGDQWGDIIPPFNNSGQSYDNPQTSLNWVNNTAGQAIWNNDCNIPGSPSPTPTPTPSEIVSPTPTPSPSEEVSPTPTPSPRVSPSPEISPSPEVSPTPTSNPTPKITPQVLGTSTPGAVGGIQEENLPTTGANDVSLYWLATSGLFGLSYYLKSKGWKKLGLK